MAIPKLESCCCVCTVRTGTIIIGWLNLIINTREAFSLWPGAVFYKEYNEWNKEVGRPIVPNDSEGDLEGVLIVLVVLFSIEAIVSGLLFIGVYKNEAQYLLGWIYTAAVIDVINSIIRVNVYGGAILPIILIEAAFSLYNDLVVYSFYREIKNGAGSNV